MNNAKIVFDETFNVEFNTKKFNPNMPNKRLEADDFIYKISSLKDKIFDHPIPCFYNAEKDMISYALNINPYDPLNAPFHFIYLREHVKEIGNISFTNRYELPSTYDDPYFIFSTGRCGSTLLSKILQCFNCISISEPDFYNQLIHQYMPIRTELSLLKFQQIYSMMTADLLSPFSDKKVFLKLSSNCNHLPELVLSSCRQKPKVIFLIRNFFSWTNSRKKTFETNIESDLYDYTKSLETLLFLKKNFNLLLIKYEDICNNSSIVIKNLESFFKIKITNQEKLKNVLINDSQEGSLISKNFIRNKNINDRDMAETKALWTKNKPNNLIDEIGLSDYI